LIRSFSHRRPKRHAPQVKTSAATMVSVKIIRLLPTSDIDITRSRLAGYPPGLIAASFRYCDRYVHSALSFAVLVNLPADEGKK
jgi:hypothetical protein